MAFKRKQQKNIEITLSDGVVMKQSLQMETSSWLRNCMVKSFLVFSVIFGAIGCFLSALDMEYYVLPTAVILFGIALLFTTIYYRGWLMDAVYVVFLFIFFFLVRSLQIYINSGYYLIVNQVFEIVEDYFELPGMQYYEIQADNEILATSIIVVFVGTVMMIVANVIISRTMNVWFLLVMTSWLWIAPMYFRLEPDALYVILMLAGYLAVWAIHSSGAYGMDRKHRDYKWKDKKGKKLRIWYVQDAATMLETIGVFAVAVLLLYGITSVVGNKDTFNLRYRQNPYKLETEEAIREISTRGFSAFNRYDAVGGMSGGQLGGVASVSPDYQTDLIVTFAPYSYEPVYLKAFTGIDYVSADSRWLTYANGAAIDQNLPYASYYARYDDERYGYDAEAQLLQKNYNADNVGAVATMYVKNVGANAMYPYAPYYTLEEEVEYLPDGGYTEDEDAVRWGNATIDYANCNVMTGYITLSQTAEYEYYPFLNQDTWEADMASSYEPIAICHDYLWNSSAYGEEGFPEIDGKQQFVPVGYVEQAEEYYLTVPEECYAAVAKASEEAGIEAGDSTDIIIQKVKDYFEEEFLYTTRPGRTPRDKDFVTHFLEKKKGYCAHFSTAATLIYRYNGIPARYIEGYVITYEDVMNSELNEEYDYEDFYKGDSPLGETGVVDVEVTDARAHAWVETFDPSLGWIQQEVTTAAVEPEEEAEAFWEVFGDTNDDEVIVDDGFYLDTMDLDLDDIQGIWIGLIVVLVLLILFYSGRKGYRTYKEYQTWHTENGNENVVAYYHIISERLRKKDAGYAQCPTYRKQIAYMAEHCDDWNWDTENLTELMEQAGYSKNGLTEFDCKRVMLELADIEKKVKKWKRSKKS